MRRSIARARRRRTATLAAKWAVMGAVIGAVIWADQRGWLLVRGSDDVADYHGALVAVVRVIDGVTLEIDRADRLHGTPRTRVRSWGLAAPPDTATEPPPDTPPDGPPVATAAARAWIGDGRVVIWLEPGRTRAADGSLFAHVERPDGATLNASLLEAGAATIDDRWPHGRLSAYAGAESRARRAGRGRWGR